MTDEPERVMMHGVECVVLTPLMRKAAYAKTGTIGVGILCEELGGRRSVCGLCPTEADVRYSLPECKAHCTGYGAALIPAKYWPIFKMRLS